jgi:hypothetical protein
VFATGGSIADTSALAGTCNRAALIAQHVLQGLMRVNVTAVRECELSDDSPRCARGVHDACDVCRAPQRKRVQMMSTLRFALLLPLIACEKKDDGAATHSATTQAGSASISDAAASAERIATVDATSPVDAASATATVPTTPAEAKELAITWMKAVRASDFEAAVRITTFPASIEPQTDNFIENRCWDPQPAPDRKEYERLLACFTKPAGGADPKAALFLVEKAIKKKKVTVEKLADVSMPAWRAEPGDAVVRVVIATGGLYDVNGLFHVVPTVDGPRIRDIAFAFDETEE